MDKGVPSKGPQRYAVASRIPLAVVMVDGDGLVSHWSTGARRLFGRAPEDAVGRPAGDLLPVTGALADQGEYEAYGSSKRLEPGLGTSLRGRTSTAIAGRARLSDLGREQLDVLWWAYPLVGPGAERLLVLAADARASGAAATLDAGVPPGEPERQGGIGMGEGGGRGGAVDASGGALGASAGGMERIAPGFGRHAEFVGSDELARGLPEILPSMSVEQSKRIVSQILDLGYPILEFSHQDRMSLTSDWGVSGRVERSRAPKGRSGRGGRRPLRRCRPGQGPQARGGP
ncbi:PAS domain-containing protein [Streptomyces albipurpureus]|uniref:PAS domain-containing protein n=1 Tax=Streptomyces albipurpureus TaxID=2897419 RepID=UPI003CE5B1C3